MTQLMIENSTDNWKADITVTINAWYYRESKTKQW